MPSSRAGWAGAACNCSLLRRWIGISPARRLQARRDRELFAKGEIPSDRSIETRKATALHGNSKQRIICEVLGYRDFNDCGEWTVDVEAAICANWRREQGIANLAFSMFFSWNCTPSLLSR